MWQTGSIFTFLSWNCRRIRLLLKYKSYISADLSLHIIGLSVLIVIISKSENQLLTAIGFHNSRFASH